MKQSIIKKIMMIMAVVSLGSSFAFAGDQLLDTLVKKGFLTSSEAKQIGSSGGSTAFTAKGKKTEKIRFNGRLQFQYDNLSIDNNAGIADPADANHFYFRRLRLGAKADLTENVHAYLNLGFEGNSLTIDAAYIGFDVMESNLQIGYRKVFFGVEELTSSSKIKTVERSAINRYFADDIDFAGRHAGVFISGDLDNLAEGLSYGASFTNAAQGEGSRLGGSSNSNNSFMYSGRLQYGFKPADNTKVKLGIDAALQKDNTVLSTDVSAYNAYATVDIDKFNFLGSYMYGDIDGVAGNTTGYALQGSYKICDNLEPVLRYSHVDTDGQFGIDPDELIRRAPPDGSGLSFDELDSFYAGLTYYIQGNEVKLTAGYEWAVADGASGSSAESETQGVRARLQLLF